jgi:hypothetical protein
LTIAHVPLRAVALDGNKTEDRRLQWLSKKRAGYPALPV